MTYNMSATSYPPSPLLTSPPSVHSQVPEQDYFLYHEGEGEGVVQELGGAADCTLMDRLLFYVLLTLEKVATHCAVINVPAHVEVMNKLLG